MTTPTTQRVPRVGEVAPDFTLPSTSGEPVTLSSYRGESQVLIAFFTLAFSEVCTAQMCEFRDDFDRYATSQTVVLPISVDSVDSLREFRRQLGLETHFLSDFKRVVCRQYGVFLEDYFYSNRAYFLVDRDGVIRWAHVEEHPGKRRESEELLEQLAALS
jgi:peroxiredoxin